MKKPFYIVFEGVDGSGKTTQARRLVERLRAAGLTTALRIEPSAGPHGAEIRHRATHGPPLSPKEAYDLFVADRRAAFDAQGQRYYDFLPGAWDVVVQDRSYFSTAVYQGDQPECPTWRAIIAEHETWVPIPNLVVLLDLPGKLVEQRLRARGQPVTAFEKDFNTLRCRYLEILDTWDTEKRSDDHELLPIHADRDADDVLAVIWGEVRRRLDRNRTVSA